MTTAHPLNETLFFQACVYEHPAVAPDCYVVRRWRILTAGTVEPEKRSYIFRSEEDARAFIAREWPDLVLLHGRDADDDPTIIAVYT